MSLFRPFLHVVAGVAVGLALSSLAHASNDPPAAAALAPAASDTSLPGEILVKLRSTAGLQGVLARHRVSLVSRFGARPIYRVKVIGTVRVSDALATMALDPEVLIAETNSTHRSPEARRNIPWAIGDETAYVAQWAPEAMRLTQAKLLARGTGVRVAVLDTGVDTGHAALRTRLLPGKDFVDGDNDPSEAIGPVPGSYGHGSHVAGLIAMVAPRAKIMPLRVLDTDGVGNAWVLAEALLYAVDPDGNPATDDGAHVINLSLGSKARTRLLDSIAMITGCVPAVPGDPAGDRSDPGYADDEARCARVSGAVIVAAAGNDGSTKREYPAAEGVYGLIAVTSSGPTHRLSTFANRGSWVDIAAPGEGVTSTVPGGWATWSGTSMAAPLVAGSAALLRSYNPRLTPRQVTKRLLRNASILCGTNLRQIDAYAALINVESEVDPCP